MVKIISGLALVLFFLMLGGRAAMLRKKGIRAIVFAQTDRSDLLLVPVFLALAYTILACAFGLPISPRLIQPFWENAAVVWLGLGLSAVALAGFALTLRSFGDSFRVGIDEKKPDKLVTTGVFAISRNPLYVCYIMFFIGQFLVNPNLALIIVIPLLALAIHRQILREETFLSAHYGADYAAYLRRVRRYL